EDVEQLDDLEAVWFPQDGDEDNDTALMKAAGQGHIEVVRFLVEQGADLDVRNRQDQNALMFAAAGGHLAVVVFLIDSGADVSPLGFLYSYEYGPYTPLMWAAYNGHLDVVNLLLEYGDIIDVPILQDSPWVPMAEMITADRLDVCRLAHDLEMARVLLENGAPVNAQTDVGTTALMFAAAFGHAEMVRFLVENGADIHIQNATTTQLESGRREGHQGVVDFLRSVEDAG
ncbi:Putative ankyrin repeat protein R840, partial [Geodia barretti]